MIFAAYRSDRGPWFRLGPFEACHTPGQVWFRVFRRGLWIRNVQRSDWIPFYEREGYVPFAQWGRFRCGTMTPDKGLRL